MSANRGQASRKERKRVDEDYSEFGGLSRLKDNQMRKGDSQGLVVSISTPQ